MKSIVAASLALLIALPVIAQTSSGNDEQATLGDAARQNRATTPAKHAKVTLNDEDVKAAGPFPDISLETDANDKQIAEAYRLYSETHSRAEIDKAVHDWYDNQVAAYDKRRDEVARIQSAQQGTYNAYYGYDGTYDPQRAREQNALASAGMQADQKIIGRDQQEMSRILSGLQRLRVTFDPKGWRYEWFNTNLYQQRY